MKELYMLQILSISEEYIVPKLTESIRQQKTYFYRDERWYLNYNPERLELDETGGIEVPDILSCEELIFFSDRLKKQLDRLGVDYIFYKKVTLISEELGIEEVYWLTSIPRIDCIDFERSHVHTEEYDYNNGIVPFYNIENPIILSECCGRNEIFRLLGSTCNRVYLFDSLCEKLKKMSLIGVRFRKVEMEEM